MNRTALVTGAGRRLGAQVALSLARAGWDIVLHFHTAKVEAEEVKKAIVALGRKCFLVQADLSLRKGAEILWSQVLELGVPVELLVSGASSFAETRWDEMAVEEMEESFLLEAWTPFALTRLMAKHRGAGFQAVFLLDARFKDREPKHLAHHLGKRRLFDFMRILAWELAPQGRVNGVAPGVVLKADEMPPEEWQTLETSNPLKRLGSPEDVTRAVLFLVESPFITGQVIYVDGGRHLKGDFFGA